MNELGNNQQEQSLDMDEIEKTYVLDFDIEPENELTKLTGKSKSGEEKNQSPQETEFINTLTLALCFSTTDLKIKYGKFASIVENFNANFKKLKNEAKNDDSKINNELFELYDNFFRLARNIHANLERTRDILMDARKKLDQLKEHLQRERMESDSAAELKSAYDGLVECKARFVSLYPERENYNQEFIHRLDKFKGEFSAVHQPSYLSFFEWVKWLDLFKLTSKFMVPLWHVSSLIFFSAAFGVSLIGLGEYFWYNRNHDAMGFLNKCLNDLYDLQELNTITYSFLKSTVVKTANEHTGSECETIEEFLRDESNKHLLVSIVDCARINSESMMHSLDHATAVNIQKFIF